MIIRYRVEMREAEREELQAMLGGGKHAARKLKRAQILLAADAGASDQAIARSVAVGGSTVYRTKRRFVLGNLEAALSEEEFSNLATHLRDWPFVHYVLTNIESSFASADSRSRIMAARSKSRPKRRSRRFAAPTG